MELEGKIVSIEVEVIDAPIYYNFMLGCTWFYEMKVAMYSIFQLVCFPHLVNVVMIDQLDYYTLDLQTNVGTTIPFVGDSLEGYSHVRERTLQKFIFFRYISSPPT